MDQGPFLLALLLPGKGLVPAGVSAPDALRGEALVAGGAVWVQDALRERVTRSLGPGGAPACS